MRNAAVTYCRISHDPHDTEAGVERQRIDTDRLADRLGYHVVDRIVDNDRSASRKARRRREGFDRLIEVAKSGEIDAVIVYDLDRFTRSPDELGRWISAAESTGVKIHTTGDLVDLADDDSIFKARILLAVAEKESANISRRVTAKARHDAEAGRPHWTTRPFGFQRDGTHVTAEVLELEAIYADVIAGRSMASIALDLNERGIKNPAGEPTKRNPDVWRDIRWQSATIGFLVRAPRNAGLRTYRGEIVGPGTWQPIVDQDTWRQAVAALDARKAGRRRAPRSLLGGLVICSECGGVMSRSGRQYRCLPRSDGYKQTCGITISGNRLDDYISGMVLEVVGDVKPANRTNKNTDGDTSRTAAEVARIRSDIDELAAMFGRGELALSAFKAAKAPLDARLSAAESALARTDTRAALERMTGPIATLAERWHDLDVALRARIIGTVIDKVTVERADRPGGPYTTDRITVRWTA